MTLYLVFFLPQPLPMPLSCYAMLCSVVKPKKLLSFRFLKSHLIFVFPLGGSSTLAEPQLDKLNKMFQDQLGSALKAKQGDTLPTLSPHGREQQAYLRNMALALKHDKGIVEEALAKFDMNEIIRPANFINAVEEISGKKGKKNKQKSKTNAGCAASHTDLDASVICMDSSDEETYVMRPFGHVAEAQRQTDSENAIVLSSDEEQENERPCE